ncbi:VCBS repeat-containing protein [Streptomyces sp. NBC_01762]|uniref:FG-GAP repeat domain-containing protein n=1 Tax=unclassified Streptomyces TaxID=2593676 RepID=UPI002DDBBF93|nr:MULTISPECIES: VCBS repeat-containing protein [unclassified Streptomyces]WSC44198.1 VCBS repeat-containing protein [Streptomyces sp. NBC_01762]WSC56852.1 VCBS repeat-containing protein [Streptomyces sp. NBC_01761]WSD23785.1 VCBS repeat-containing protein [Streptomyces sp. NBC_01751]WSJ54198.1 VCBS repeat-containing protein [Streptomyces sp. NBC_01318]
MRTNSRRALRLASALVAAGLALSAAPPALADDDGSSLLTLTDSQAETLADHARLNAYADADRETVDPQGATTGSDTSGADQGTDQGSGSHLDEGTGTDAGTDAAVTISPESTLEGVRGLAATAPAGKGGDYFTLHSLGSVQRSKADGTPLWRRDNASLYADWGVKNSRPWQAEPYPARIVMGYNAVSPFTPASDQGYVTGDLTGDGVDDVVFSASVGVSPYRPFTSPGSTLPNGTFVTVLDGRTGKTLWSKLYAYAYNVKLVGRTLVVTDAPYYNLNSPAAATATVSGIRFSYADGALTPTDTWTYDTGARAGTAWGALEDLGGGLVAASYNQRKTATVAGRGRTLVLDTADGAVKWQTESALYSRQLHLDTARGRLVALEQSDPTDGVKYELDSYSLADGKRTTLDTRINAVPIDMTIGDLRGDRKAEYVVSESTLSPTLYINANTVRVVDGTDPGTLLWSSTVKRAADNGHDGPSAWSLDVVDGSLVTAAQDDTGMDTAENPGGGQYASLTVFSGSGDVRWQQKGIGASPMFNQVYRDADGQHIRTVDQNQNIRTYGFGNGKQQSILPLQGDLAYARSADIDGDKKNDLVVGGKSNGVWAYSGPSLTAGKPKLLWKATVPGQVHRIEKGDVNGDGHDDFVVAADTAVAVVDGRNGKVIERIDGNGQFVRSVTVADLDGDKRADIVVPTDKLRAYRGDGSKLWTYGAPDSAGGVVFGDVAVGEGRVYAQYTSTGSLDKESPAVDGVALDAKKGTVRWTAAPKAPAESVDGKLYGAGLNHGVFTSPEIPYAGGHAVVYTWFAATSTTAEGAPDGSSLRAVVEIRDGRTGEVLHHGLAGGPWSIGSYFTGPEGLVLAGTASFRTYAAGGQDHRIYTLPTTETGGFLAGPGGRRLLVGGIQGGLSLWDPSVLTTGDDYPAAAGSTTFIGAREYFSGDLDGDGVDEVVNLGFDETGFDRMTELLGGRYLNQFTALSQMTVSTLS